MEENTLNSLEGKINITSRIVDIKLEKFHLETLSAEQIKNLNKEKVMFEFTPKAKMDVPKSRLHIDLFTDIYSDETKAQKIGEIVSIGDFDIINLAEILEKFKGIPNIVLSVFLSTLIATTRGMYIIKSEGTFLDKIMIPIISMETFFKTPPLSAAPQSSIPK
ncbi:MAG: hypothetical protein ACLQQ4_07115 [Bacteroidia bacterium]